MTDLNMNLRNNFPEAKMGPDFCQNVISDVKKLIGNSTSFAVVGMPAMGISIFLKYLATLEFAHLIHIDINGFSYPTEAELFKQLPGKEELEILAKKHQRVVVIFNRFDRLQKIFSQNFFARLRVLRDVDREKIVMIFAANRPLAEQSPKSIEGGNLNMFSKTYYIKLYGIEDLKKLVRLNSPKLLKHPQFELALKLSGGHYQLLQLLLKLDSLDNPVADPAIKLQLKELYNFLNYHQKKQIQKISFGKLVKDIDPYLVDIGYVPIPTPLLADFIKQSSKLKIPVMENKLFRFLKYKEGKVALKEEIFNNLWDGGEASDWALNALIYRLRKNLAFISSGYVIESYKKVGYSLIKN